MPWLCMRKELYVDVVERTKRALYFSIVLLRGKHTCGVRVEEEWEIGLAVEDAAGPLVNREEALELWKK